MSIVSLLCFLFLITNKCLLFCTTAVSDANLINDRLDTKALKKLKGVLQSRKTKHVVETKGAVDDVEVVARVNDIAITINDVVNYIRFMFYTVGREYDEKYAKVIYKYILRKLKRACMIESFAARSGNFITKADVDAEVKNMATANGQSVDEFVDSLKAMQIDYEIFRGHIKMQLLFGGIQNSLVREVEGDIRREDVERRVAFETEQQKKYRVRLLILSVPYRNGDSKQKEKIELIRSFIEQGMLDILLNSSNNVTDTGMVSFDSLDEKMQKRIKKLSVGECTEAYVDENMYKVVVLHDTADPGCEAQSKSTYKCYECSIVYQGAFATSSDVNAANSFVESLNSVDNEEGFIEVCNKYNIKYSEMDIERPSNYLVNAFKRARFIIMPAADDEGKIRILFFRKKVVDKAKDVSYAKCYEEMCNEFARRKMQQIMRIAKAMCTVRVEQRELP